LTQKNDNAILIVIMAALHRYKQRQLQLLPPDSASAIMDGQRLVYRPLPAEYSTFKCGLDEPVHRWFRLTPSFGPELVREVLDELSVSNDQVVLDPFAGAGTTLIECQLHAIKSYGFEIHPFLSWVAQTSLTWDLDIDSLRIKREQLKERFAYLTRILPDNLEDAPVAIPKIHDPYRWWRKDILRDILILKSALNDVADSAQVESFLRLVLAGVLVPDLTNVTLGRLQLHFIDRSQHRINVWSIFDRHLVRMIEDLAEVQKKCSHKAELIVCDSTQVPTQLNIRPVDCVITSPPYPNRYSYVWNTRPHLYLFDFFNEARQASDLDKCIIGGTWGTATSVLAKGRVEPLFSAVTTCIVPIAEKIRKSDNLMANYLVKYFNGLSKQLAEMGRFLNKSAKLAYVIGCSELKGTYVETDVLLAEIMEKMGFSIYQIRRLRKRNSGVNLYESIVYAKKS